jgi:cyclic lactone autoinducer peptide
MIVPMKELHSTMNVSHRRYNLDDCIFTKGGNHMKGKLIAMTAKMVAKVASASAGTLCLAIFHQPKVPQKLIQK